ncbi:MAG TPA: hypothetical protein VHF26_21925 [Trebonia sp.]|nr:hypothetical protein [Trebonia sp.]
MPAADAHSQGADDTPVALITPPAQTGQPGQPGRRLPALGALAGIAGPVMLAAYFAVPALVHWPYAGASPGELVTYATAHRLLFFGGGWLQATGALLSILFFLVLLQLSGARNTLAGAAVLTGCALLLSTVVIEAALLEAVPIAAGNGDQATVATTFALSNGVFSRIFPLAPAPLVFAGIGFALSGAGILPRLFARTALLFSALFLVAGLAAVFATAGLILAIVMSVAEAVWTAAAAIALARATARRSRRRQPAMG